MSVRRTCPAAGVKHTFEQVTDAFRQELFRLLARLPPCLDWASRRDPADDPDSCAIRVHLCKHQASSPGVGSPGKYVYRCRFDSKRLKRLKYRDRRLKPVFYSWRHSLLGRSSTGAASRAIFSRGPQNVVPIIEKKNCVILLRRYIRGFSL
jgi:hypothetical protein